MLRNLKAEMVRQDIKPKHLAELLGVRPATIYDKLNGKYAFTFDEALKIRQTHFPEQNFEDLFMKDTQDKQREGKVI